MKKAELEQGVRYVVAVPQSWTKTVFHRILTFEGFSGRGRALMGETVRVWEIPDGPDFAYRMINGLHDHKLVEKKRYHHVPFGQIKRRADPLPEQLDLTGGVSEGDQE